MSPSLCLVGGMYLIGLRGKSSRTIIAIANSRKSVSSRAGSISKEWPKPISSSFIPARRAKVSLISCEAITVCAESLGGGAVRNIVEQRLRRAADDGDHVGALLGGGFRLLHVVVDVAGGDDDVLPGRAIERSDAKVALALLPLVDARLQLADRGARLRAHLLAELLVLGGGKRWQLFVVRRDSLDRLQRILARRRAQGAAQPVRRAPLQHAGVAQAVDHQIRQRSTAGTCAGDPEQPQDGA